MSVVTIEDAQVRLTDLINQLGPGDEVVITRDEKPVARLTIPADPSRDIRRLGMMKARCCTWPRISTSRSKTSGSTPPDSRPLHLFSQIGPTHFRFLAHRNISQVEDSLPNTRLRCHAPELSIYRHRRSARSHSRDRGVPASRRGTRHDFHGISRIKSAASRRRIAAGNARGMDG